jgi:hypothetical protein
VTAGFSSRPAGKGRWSSILEILERNGFNAHVK